MLPLYCSVLHMLPYCIIILYYNGSIVMVSNINSTSWHSAHFQCSSFPATSTNLLLQSLQHIIVCRQRVKVKGHSVIQELSPMAYLWKLCSSKNSSTRFCILQLSATTLASRTMVCAWELSHNTTAWYYFKGKTCSMWAGEPDSYKWGHCTLY